MDKTENVFEIKLNTLREGPPVSLWRIKYKDFFVVLGSGKTVWRQIGHAKAALKNYMYESMYTQRQQYVGMGMSWTEAHKHTQEDFRTFVQDNIEFVQLL
jgi:hypothetical protein